MHPRTTSHGVSQLKSVQEVAASRTYSQPFAATMVLRNTHARAASSGAASDLSIADYAKEALANGAFLLAAAEEAAEAGQIELFDRFSCCCKHQLDALRNMAVLDAEERSRVAQWQQKVERLKQKVKRQRMKAAKPREAISATIQRLSRKPSPVAAYFMEATYALDKLAGRYVFGAGFRRSSLETFWCMWWMSRDNDDNHMSADQRVRWQKLSNYFESRGLTVDKVFSIIEAISENCGTWHRCTKKERARTTLQQLEDKAAMLPHLADKFVPLFKLLAEFGKGGRPLVVRSASDVAAILEDY